MPSASEGVEELGDISGEPTLDLPDVPDDFGDDDFSDDFGGGEDLPEPDFSEPDFSDDDF